MTSLLVQVGVPFALPQPPYTISPCFHIAVQGGDFIGGLWYIINNGGIDNDTDYPYEVGEQLCSQ